MKIINGKKVFGGIAIGKIHFLKKAENIIDTQNIHDIDMEITRYERAKNIAIEQLQNIYEKAKKQVGSGNAQIFDSHIVLLDDHEYKDSIYDLIQNQKYSAEYAIASTRDTFSNMFESMNEDYFNARAIDIRDISNRVIEILNGNNTDYNIGNNPVIVVAEELTPSETMQMDRNNILAFVTRSGSTNSHTAILAKTMGIPALMGVDINESWNKKIAIIDSYKGELIIEPDEETLNVYKIQADKDTKDKQLLQNLKGKESMTLSGQRIKLCANIGNISDLEGVLQNDADGIGLFRSEFLYLEKDGLPTEEEQFNIYRYAVEAMSGKEVIIRTVDIGADKQVDYFNLDKEDNPALGYRGIRICLNEPEIFKTQLRAILRASMYGTIGIMYPMIISIEEVREIKKIVEEVKSELTKEGIPYGQVTQGIMIETPAAAILSDILAKEVDFFSIGTNDLTQYTLALDRQNSKLDRFYNPYHKAILSLIEIVVKNGHEAGIWVGICGELGSDVKLTEYFLEIGIDELSVPSSYVLPLRNIIREMK